MTPTDKYKYSQIKVYTYIHLDLGIGASIVLLFINPVWPFAFIDYIFHWHIDWIQTNITLKYGWKKEGKAFWRLQTFDQITHYATYV